MIHNKVTGDKLSSKPLVTDGKIYLLNYNVVEKVETDDEGVETTIYEYDQIRLTKNEYDYEMSIKDVNDSFVSKLLRKIHND